MSDMITEATAQRLIEALERQQVKPLPATASHLKLKQKEMSRRDYYKQWLMQRTQPCGTKRTRNH